MAIEPGFSFSVAEFSAALLAEREILPRARITAGYVAQLVDGAAVLVFAVEDEPEPAWSLKATVGEVAVDQTVIPFDTGTLGEVAANRTVLQFSARELSREDYAHLDVRQTVTSLSYVPIAVEERLLGCIEIVSFGEAVTEATLETIAEMAEYAAIGFASAMGYELERHASLSSVMRLTQLYDIEKVFNSTLEMARLLPVICSKVQDLTRAAAVNLWMVDKDDLLLVQQAGEDRSVHVGDHQGAGDGIAGQVAESGEPVVLQADDPVVLERNARHGSEIASVMAAPLLDGESLVGVLEVVGQEENRIFDEDELFTLTEVAGSAAQALHNSSLLQAERKIEVLQTLVRVSQEITSTLNQERVLQAIVNQPQLVIPYERAAIALEQRQRLTIRAVSGVAQLNDSDPNVARLQTLLRWASGLDQDVYVTQHEDEISDPRPETREKFRRYFEESGSRGLYAVPLADEEGRLGMLSFESSDPDFLNDLHFEIIKVLTSQATLALRNASLYKEVPFIGVLEPLIEKKRRFMAADKRRRGLILGASAAALLFLILVPIPMRIAGDAQVAPSQTQYVRANADGVVQQVLVREGDQVSPGTILAEMEDWGERSTLAGAQAKYKIAIAEMNRALVNNDATLAGRRQLEANYLSGESDRALEQLSRRTLRSDITGTVVTPHLENVVGKKLEAGDAVMEVVNTGEVTVDLAIAERDVVLLKTGAPANIKLEGFPTQIFHGTVGIISPASGVAADHRVFFARVRLANPDGKIKTGMQGYGKIYAGLHPAGYVLFRDVALWAWSKAWNWFGW